MEKKVITNEEKGVCVVLYYITNPYESILVGKGIARCHASDTFDPVIGEKIANNRALRQYYNNLVKEEKHRLERCDNNIVYLSNRKIQLQESIIRAESKLAELKDEYESYKTNE